MSSVQKRVRFVDIYDHVNTMLSKWLEADHWKSRNLSLDTVKYKAQQFARELEVENFQDNEWCRNFFEKNIAPRKEREILLASTRKTVSSYVEPIGNVPVHAVACCCNIIVSVEGSNNICNFLFCCMSNGTKLPPMLITNLPFESKLRISDGMLVVYKEDPSVLDSNTLIEWLNSVWCLRHNFIYQTHSLLVSNIPFDNDLQLLLKAAATEVVIIPEAVIANLHPVEPEIMQEILTVLQLEFAKHCTKMTPEKFARLFEKISHSMATAWSSISTSQIAKQFEKLGLDYEEDEQSVESFPFAGFGTEILAGHVETLKRGNQVVSKESREENKSVCTIIDLTDDNSEADEIISEVSILYENPTNSLKSGGFVTKEKPESCSLYGKENKDELETSDLSSAHQKLTCNSTRSNIVSNVPKRKITESRDSDIGATITFSEFKDSDNEVQITVVRSEEPMHKSRRINETECLLCKMNILKHECVRQLNVSVGENGKLSECYYCKKKFESDLDMQVHACKYPF